MRLGEIFCENMVLQAGKPIRIFGEGEGEGVISFLGKTYFVKSSGGTWMTELPACPYGGPYEMEVCLNGETTKICGIRIGEVILVAGQSNVQFRLGEEVPRREYPEDGLLRFFALTRPEKDAYCFNSSDGWRGTDPDSVLKHSAIGYHLGVMIRKSKNVAVGVVECYQGASVIQSWMSKKQAGRAEFSVPIHERHMDYTLPEGEWYRAWSLDGALHDAMFLKIVPYSFSAVIWYQGESNTSIAEGKIYLKMLQAMVKEWREELMDEKLFFVVVVIADYIDEAGEGWSAVQDAQLHAEKTIERVLSVDSRDVSDSSTIHPTDKLLLSQRIFRAWERLTKDGCHA